MKKIRSIATVALFGVLTVGLALVTFLSEDSVYSVYERRQLAQMPEYDETLPISYYLSDWEDYLVDQFAFRDEFRFMKSIFARDILHSSDVNGYIVKDGSQAQLLYPTNREQIDSNLSVLGTLRRELFADSSAYFAVIPDKSVYMDAPIGLDYGYIRASAAERIDAKQIDLTTALSEDDFYRTDIHWKQEELEDVYETIRAQMNPDLPAWDSLGLDTQSAGNFYGVLYGQAAYPTEPDVLNYLTGDWLDDCTYTIVDTGSQAALYQPDKAAGDDPYYLFMGGEFAVTVIENPNVHNGRELVLFRDSFARALAPLLAAGYEKITLIDLRWIRPSYLTSEQIAPYLPIDGTTDRKVDLLVLLSGQVLDSMRY